MFVDRDTDGNIVAAFANPQRGNQEWVDPQSEEAIDYSGKSPRKLEAKRLAALKDAARAGLAGEAGDWGDNLTDILRLIALQWAISSGVVKDQETIDIYDQYCKGLYDGFGGAKDIVPVLLADAVAFKKWIVDYYYVEKAKKE